MKIKLLNFTKRSEELCASAAHVCYSDSKISKLNERSRIVKILNTVIRNKHYSVLEHASFTFSVDGVSRTLLAQLTRHRLASFSVQSQRYVKFTRNKYNKFIIPKTIKKNKLMLNKCYSLLNKVVGLYNELLEQNISIEDARYILPNASVTNIVFTMNARELRHFFSLRCCNKAQWEIRNMACKILKIVKLKAPLLFLLSGPTCVRAEICQELIPCKSPWTRERITI
ncbi:MAG: FAD-dependent thymidylate synthase [Endomicrobium sp.]|jgi:thymidylate synthase (FAD)|nr:FAD-dependent thymidylate synthase [Endomicrobium sp.]